MTNEDLIAELNAHAPPALAKLGGSVAGYDDESGLIEMRYSLDESFCHSGDIVQGGYIAGMLDAAMAHVTFMRLRAYVAVATLELKVSYLDIVRPGTLTATARAVKLGKSVGFFDAELFNANGDLLATATSTAKIFRIDPRL